MRFFLWQSIFIYVLFFVIYLCSGSPWSFTLQKHFNMLIFKGMGISFEVKLKIKKKCLNFVKNWPCVSIPCQNNHKCKQLGKKADVSHCPALTLHWHSRSLRSRILKRILPKTPAVFQNFSSPQWDIAGLFQQLLLWAVSISTMCSHLSFTYTVMTVYEHEMCI